MKMVTEPILVVIFDSAQARFFERHPDGRLESINQVDSGLHRFTREDVSDRPGRNASSAGGGGHAYEARHDPHKQEKHDFVAAIVKVLEQLLDQRRYVHFAVVAPERSLGELHALASSKLMDAILVEIPKELANFPQSELEQRLTPHFAPGTNAVKRAAGTGPAAGNRPH